MRPVRPDNLDGMYPLLFRTVLSRMDPETAHHAAMLVIRTLGIAPFAWITRAVTRPGAARVAIILLNHNGLQLTRDCLRSLLAIDYPDYRVFVIDNGSARD